MDPALALERCAKCGNKAKLFTHQVSTVVGCVACNVAVAEPETKEAIVVWNKTQHAKREETIQQRINEAIKGYMSHPDRKILKTDKAIRILATEIASLARETEAVRFTAACKAADLVQQRTVLGSN